MLGVFATLAAVGFAAAYVAPATSTMMTAARADTTTLYAETLSEVQTLGPATGAGQPVSFDRGGYSVAVTPKPVVEDAGAALKAPPRYTGGGSPAQWMAGAGIPESDWGYVDFIVKKESGWNPNATNKSSGACGLVQVYPCSKLANAYDPVVNLRWADAYAKRAYGSWQGAYSKWQERLKNGSGWW